MSTQLFGSTSTSSTSSTSSTAPLSEHSHHRPKALLCNLFFSLYSAHRSISVLCESSKLIFTSGLVSSTAFKMASCLVWFLLFGFLFRATRTWMCLFVVLQNVFKLSSRKRRCFDYATGNGAAAAAVADQVFWPGTAQAHSNGLVTHTRPTARSSYQVGTKQRKTQNNKRRRETWEKTCF